MTQDEFENNLYDIFNGCNPEDGITDVGQDRLDDLYNLLFNKKKEIIMSDTTPKVFEVNAIEYFPVIEHCEPTEPKVHLFKDPIIGISAEAVEFQVKRSLTKDFDDNKVQAFFGRLKVKVVLVDFQE
jgi:hypothetical protein